MMSVSVPLSDESFASIEFITAASAGVLIREWGPVFPFIAAAATHRAARQRSNPERRHLNIVV
jgi:hypothetical protein